MKRADINENLLKIVSNILEASPVIFAYVYGSIALDLAHPFSDLDVAIYVPRLSIREKMDLEMSLSLEIDKNLKSAPPSDVRIINDLPIAVAGQIVTDGILVYCRDDHVRIDYETSIRKAYFDFLPVINNYQRRYLEQMNALIP